MKIKFEEVVVTNERCHHGCHLGLGRIYYQIKSCGAGFFTAILSEMLKVVLLPTLSCVVMILSDLCDALLWVFCGPSSCWGVYEGTGNTGAFLLLHQCLSYRVRDDAHHHSGVSVHPRFLHVSSAWTMSYSHLRVKERAARFLWNDRIQNFQLIERPVTIAHWMKLTFDQTLGFPGEGPKWSVVSANVDSFLTNVNYLHWDADAFMLQEARVAESNIVEAQRKAALCNFQLYCSQPLRKIQVSNGNYRAFVGVLPRVPAKRSLNPLQIKMTFLVHGPSCVVQQGSQPHGIR